jgi:hypothetical protein
MSRAGCQARMGVVALPCVGAGCRTFALDSRASVSHLHHGGGEIELAGMPGETSHSPVCQATVA